jgi:aminoglycoside phosphotransferase (APT) family kinase protein
MTAATTAGEYRTVKQALQAALAEVLGRAVETGEPVLLAGGASKEAWAVDAEGLPLLVRRAAVGVIHSHTLTLAQEFEVLCAAHEAGVTVPRPYGYVPDLEGREAFVMERLDGETIGRRIVQRPELAAARAALPLQLAEELARIHAIPPARLPFLGEAGLEALARELEETGEPHPAIELGLAWLRAHPPRERAPAVAHGDFRLGNVVVSEHGLVGVLDWEFAHLDTPVRDLAWPLVRAWRFGVPERRLGGIGEVEPYLARYNELTGLDVGLDELAWWELAGNVAWAVGCLTQARRHLTGQDRSVELAILGRLAAEVEYEIVHLLERAA